MIGGLVLTAITGVLWAVLGVIFSVIVWRKQSLLSFLQISCALSTIGAGIFLTPWPRVLAGDMPGWVGLAVSQLLAGLINAYGMYCLQRAMNAGHHGMVWTMTQAALIFPFLYALIVIGEPPQTLGIIGVGVIILSLVMLGRSKTQSDHVRSSKLGKYAWLYWALWTFVVLGAVNILASMPSYWPDWTGKAGLRTTLFFAGNLLGFVLADWTQPRRWTRDLMGIGLLHGTLAMVCIATLFAATDALSVHQRAGIVYPLGISIDIIAFALYAFVFLRERSGVLGYLGVSTTLAGVVLVVLAAL
ncbi:MAG: hypothetical protein IT443_04580 [Phycisphaeraceae bacterium]|nr:hypothetical protein [Phycisphaeraceae bacterium]